MHQIWRSPSSEETHVVFGRTHTPGVIALRSVVRRPIFFLSNIAYETLPKFSVIWWLLGLNNECCGILCGLVTIWTHSCFFALNICKLMLHSREDVERAGVAFHVSIRSVRFRCCTSWFLDQMLDSLSFLAFIILLPVREEIVCPM